MADDESRPGARRARRLGKGCVVSAITVAAIVLGFLLVVANFSAPVEILWTLATGWLPFLLRTLPQVTGNFSIAAMAVLCTALTLTLAHSFLSGFAGAVGKSGSTRRWRFRWTACGFVSVLMLFIIGMAAGGIVHQLGWIASSPEPMVQSDWENSEFRRAMELDSVIRGFTYSHHVHQHDLQAAIDDFNDTMARRDFGASGSAVLERFQTFLIVAADDPEQYAGMIVVRRQRPAQGKLIGLLSIGDQQADIRSGEELRQWLEKYRDRLVLL